MNSDNEIIEGALMSPTGVSRSTELDFSGAIREMLDGKKVTKLEWDNPEEYCFLKAEILHIHRNGQDHKWIISQADLEGTDWFVKEEK